MKKRLCSTSLALCLCLNLLSSAAFAADDTTFRDISGHWAEKAITEWQEKGYLGGYDDGSFQPNSNITRAGYVKLLNRALGLTEETGISFSDVQESDWFYADVAKAVAAGYANGSTDSTFQPNAPITRAEAATMLARALALPANESRAEEFSDAASFASWAKGSIGAVATSGYMTGYSDGTFGAKDNITRAEAVVTLDRAQDVTITAAGTELTDKTVAGDLTIAESVGEGKVTLKNVTVEGDLIIRGGAGSVSLDGVTVKGEVRLEKENLNLRLSGDTKLGTVRVLDKAKISGSSTIENLIVSVSGVTVDRTLNVRKTETTDGAKAPTVSGSGSSSSGSTTYKIINGVAEISPIMADYGTSQEDALKKLPESVALYLQGGGSVSANVTWSSISGYDAEPLTTTGYTAIGTVTLPAGCTYNGTLTAQATVTVRGADRTVSKNINVTGIEVETGKLTGENAASALPDRIALKNAKGNPILSNGVNLTAEVTWKFWNCTTYTQNGSLTGISTSITPTAGFQGSLGNYDTKCVNTFIGTVTLPDGYVSVDNKSITVQTTITVKPTGEATPKQLNSIFLEDITIEEYLNQNYNGTDKILAYLNEHRKAGEQTVMLYCDDDDGRITAALPGDATWVYHEYSVSSSDKYDVYTYLVKPSSDRDSFTTEDFKNLPVGYELPYGGILFFTSVSVKKLDFSKLDGTIANIENNVLNKFALTEEEAIREHKIFLTTEDKKPEDVTNGLSFFVDKNHSYQSFQQWIAGVEEYREPSRFADELDYKDQIQDLANHVQANINDFNAALDNGMQTGTKLTDSES